MFNDVASASLQTALTGLAKRQRVIADNIANVDTPGYLAGRVSFEDSLRSAVAAGTSPASATSTVSRSSEPTREDGNNVNLDDETVSNIDTGMRYQLLLRAVDAKFGLLHDVIKNGG